MARGQPFLWSTVLGTPFSVTGGYLLLMDHGSNPIPIGFPLILFSGFIMLVGGYIHSVSPTEPTMGDNESVVDTRYPYQKVAIAKIGIGFLFLLAAGYLLFLTTYPYVYPTVTLVVGLYFFSSGLKTYWTNTLTTYYITTGRIISEYRFIALRRQEIPLDKIRAVEERKSIMETLVGLGNIRVASGGGGGSVELNMRNIAGSDSFAGEIRKLNSPGQS
jgi:hypothetical protein